MLIWIFFIGDLLSLIALLGMHYDFIPGWRFAAWCILYLIMKGAIFFGDFLSVLDVILAVYMIIMLIFNVSWFLTYIGIAYLVYKLIFTMMH